MSGGSELDRSYRGGFAGGTHHFALRVYFEDTDAAGLVYHANFLRFMERARTEMLRAAGIDHGAAMQAGDGVYAVAEVAIRYRAPARLDDELVVLSECRDVRAAAVVIHQRVMRGAQLIAEATVTAAFLSLEGRPKRQPRQWLAAFERRKREPK